MKLGVTSVTLRALGGPWCVHARRQACWLFLLESVGSRDIPFCSHTLRFSSAPAPVCFCHVTKIQFRKNSQWVRNLLFLGFCFFLTKAGTSPYNVMDICSVVWESRLLPPSTEL